MARPASTYGFYYRFSMSGKSHPAVLEVTLDDTATVTIGDAITISNGYASTSGAATSIAGILVGIVDKNGIPFQMAEATATGTKTNDITYVTASDNTTGDMVKAQLIADTDAVFEGQADSTLTLAEEYEFFELTSAGDRVTGSGSTTAAQMQLLKMIGVSGTGTTGYFRIAETEFPTTLTV